MRFSDEVLLVVREANTNNPSNIENATAEALRGVKRLSSYDELVDTLVEHAVQDLVHDARHEVNRIIRQLSGAYSSKPKTLVGDSPAVMRAEVSVYHYRIAGTSLGEVLGKELLDIAAHEENRANGHIFNTRLCRRLAEIVPNNKKVKNAVKEKQLKMFFSEMSVKEEKPKAVKPQRKARTKRRTAVVAS